MRVCEDPFVFEKCLNATDAVRDTKPDKALDKYGAGVVCCTRTVEAGCYRIDFAEGSIGLWTSFEEVEARQFEAIPNDDGLCSQAS